MFPGVAPSSEVHPSLLEIGIPAMVRFETKAPAPPEGAGPTPKVSDSEVWGGAQNLNSYLVLCQFRHCGPTTRLRGAL